MTTMVSSTHWISSAWEVLLLFLIPIGGGIPAGVLLARVRALPWLVTVVLYFISDVILALLFEPLLLLLIAAGKRSAFLARFTQALKNSVQKTASRYGTRLGPIALITLSFGVDPMTGRAAAVAAGHGFVSGWTLAILGDMLFFLLIMASTLWLNNLLGDGTWTTVIIMVAMMGGPPLVRRARKLLSRKEA